MGGEHHEANHFVTQAELRAVQTSIESQIGAVTKAIGNLAEVVKQDRHIQEKRDEELRSAIERQGSEFRNELRIDRQASRIPPAVVIGGIALLLTLAGMAATLAVFAISGAVAPVQRDVAENIDELETQWRLTFPRLRWEGKMEERINTNRGMLEKLEVYEREDASRLGKQIQEVEAALKQHIIDDFQP